MQKKGVRPSRRYFYLWGTISAIAVVCLIMTIQSNHAVEIEEDTMNLDAISRIELPGLPPIDVAVPSKFETASFGLG
ncbi:MAG: hypothetical protein ACN4GW_06190 [Desulforhopalus sp.]